MENFDVIEFERVSREIFKNLGYGPEDNIFFLFKSLYNDNE